MLLLASACCLLSTCKREPNKRAALTVGIPLASAAPRLRLETSTLDAGAFLQDETVQRSTIVSNVGTLPLVISNVERSPACTGQVEPDTLAPGASGKLTLNCNSHLYGPARQQVVVDSNDPKSPKTVQTLVFDVTPLLAFDTPVVRLEMAFGQEKTQQVNLVGALLDKARVKSTMPAPPDVEIIAEPPKTDKIRSFQIHCKGRKVGHNAGNLFITTNLDDPKDVAIPYECIVNGTLEVMPTNPVINLKVSGPKFVNIDVRSSRPGFEVISAKVIAGPFAASFSPVEGGAFRVTVIAEVERIDDESRGVTGTLVITSNDHTEPQKEIPLTGLGQVNRATPLDPL